MDTDTLPRARPRAFRVVPAGFTGFCHRGLPSGAESKSLFGGILLLGPVIYWPREGRAESGGRGGAPAYARQRLAEPGRAAEGRPPAPATRVQFARTCLRLRLFQEMSS